MSDSFSKSEFQVSPMTAEDVPQILAIEEKVYSHPWTDTIFKDCLRVGYTCWVCKKDNHTVGYLILSIAVEEMHILNLCIHPDQQRMNLGTLMIQQAEKLARQNNAEKSFLEVRPSNVGAIRLYQKQGYEQIGLRKDYYPANDGREDAIVMCKALTIA